MEGLGYGEVDADDAERIRTLERDVIDLRIEIGMLTARLNTQQPAIIHHHYPQVYPGTFMPSPPAWYGVVKT